MNFLLNHFRKDHLENYLNLKILSLLPNIKSQMLFIEDTTSRYSDLLHVAAI